MSATTQASTGAIEILASAETLRWEIGGDFHEQLVEAVYGDAARIAIDRFHQLLVEVAADFPAQRLGGGQDIVRARGCLGWCAHDTASTLSTKSAACSASSWLKAGFSSTT